MAIAYLMWKQNKTFDNTLAAVKAIRGVANPNIGFTCQVCLPAGSETEHTCSRMCLKSMNAVCLLSIRHASVTGESACSSDYLSLIFLMQSKVVAFS